MVEQKQVLLRHTEEFKFEKVKNDEGKTEVIISGNAMPLGKMSRNKVFYRPESVKKAYKSLEGVAFLNGHDPSQSLGHVAEVGITETHVTYKADIDPSEEKYLNKVERKDIKHVSVGCMVDAVEFMEDGTIECDVTEFVELSAVTVPGFQDTSAEKEGLNNLMILTEAFGSKEQLEKLKSKKEADDEDEDDKDKDKEADDDKDDEEEKKENPKDDPDYDGDEDEANDDEDDSEETDDEDDEEEKLKEAGVEDDASPEEKMEKLTSRVGELFSKFDEVINRLSILEANMDALNDSEEDAEGDDSEDLSPNKDEKFVDSHEEIKRDKKELDAKEKALTGGNSKKINVEKEVVDMNKVRLKNTI